MTHCYVIEEDKISLRPVNYEDLEIMRNWRNKDSIRKCFISQEIISSEQQVKWFESYSKKENDIMFIIQWEGKPVGTIALYDVNTEEKTAEFGRLLIGEESVRGLGIGKKATECLCKFGFKKLDLQKIYLEVFKDNNYALKVYEKAGFIREKEVIKNDKTLYYMCLNKGRV